MSLNKTLDNTAEDSRFFNINIDKDDAFMITGAIIEQLDEKKNVYMGGGLLWAEMEDAIKDIVKDPSFTLKTFEENVSNHITSEQTLTDFQLVDVNGTSYPGAEALNERLCNGDFEYEVRYTKEETDKLLELQETYNWLHVGTELPNNRDQELAERFVVTHRSGTFNTIYSTNSIEELEKELSYEVDPETDKIITKELKDFKHTPEAVQELTEAYFPRHGVDRDTQTLTGKEMKRIGDLLESGATAQDILTHVKDRTLEDFSRITFYKTYTEDRPPIDLPKTWSTKAQVEIINHLEHNESAYARDPILVDNFNKTLQERTEQEVIPVLTHSESADEFNRACDLIYENVPTKKIIKALDANAIDKLREHVMDGTPYKEPEPAKKKMKVNFHRPTTSNELSR